jgi:hypothetical protein
MATAVFAVCERLFDCPRTGTGMYCNRLCGDLGSIFYRGVAHENDDYNQQHGHSGPQRALA